MALSTLTSKGQVTIPKNVRDSLKLHAGDKVEFIENSKHEFVLKPVTLKATDVAGLLNKFKRKRSVSIEEMNEAISKQVLKENK